MASSQEPDPRVIWRLLGESVRPWIGWLLTALGAAALALGYFGVSREVLVAKQLPFVVSGGMTGIALVFIGGVLLGTQDVRRQVKRIDEFEEKLGDLHRVLLTTEHVAGTNGHVRAPEPSEQSPADATTTGELTRPTSDVVVVPGGSSYHRPDCAVVADRDSLEHLSVGEAGSRELSPCRRCQPDPVEATTA